MTAADALDPALKKILQHVRDPELPQVSIVGLGIIRSAETLPGDGGTRVVMTPTYSGCPALEVMRRDVERVLEDRGFGPVQVEYQYDPPWSSDWVDEESRALLKAGGVTPPATGAEKLVEIGARRPACPFCDSRRTRLESEFGSTACKSMYFCTSCVQPFEVFKSI